MIQTSQAIDWGCVRLALATMDASGAGFTMNPLDEPAPRTQKTRAASPRYWSGPRGHARDTQRLCKPT
jgi:hypothetical protein